MKALISILEKTSTYKGMMVLAILYGVVFGMIISKVKKLTEITGGIGILDFNLGYSHSKVISVFGSYGEAGMSLYSSIQILDLINPAIYSLLFSSIVYLIVRHSRAIWLSVLPLLAGILDYSENLTLYMMARSYPEISESLVSFSSILSFAKYFALFTAVGSMFVGGIILVKKR